jgi:transposase
MYDLLEPTRTEGETRINSRVSVRKRGGQVEVFKDSELYAVFAQSDRGFRKAVIIQLARLGAASFRELCAGFQVDRETLERYLIHSQERGLKAIMDDKPGPKGPWKADHATRVEIIKEFVSEPGINDSEIARRVSARRPVQVDRKIVGRILRHAGLKPGPDSDVVRGETSSSQLDLHFKRRGR